MRNWTIHKGFSLPFWEAAFCAFVVGMIAFGLCVLPS